MKVFPTTETSYGIPTHTTLTYSRMDWLSFTKKSFKTLPPKFKNIYIHTLHDLTEPLYSFILSFSEWEQKQCNTKQHNYND